MQSTTELSHFIFLALSFVFFGSSLTQPAAAQTDLATNVLDFCGTWAFGTSNPCDFYDSQDIPYREYRRLYFPIPLGANYDLVVTVWTTKGDVDAQLLLPNGTALSTSSERIGNDVVTASRAVLSRYPGNYTLVLRGVADAMSTYGVMIWTPDTETIAHLAPEDKAVLSSIASDCCPDDDDVLPDSCVTLLRATALNATDEDNLCRKPPNTCDQQGHLTKLFLSGGDRGNLVCSSFPSALNQLSSLEVLDWTGNYQIGTLEEVAKVLAPLNGTLKRLYLGRNTLSGSLGCELVNAGRLQILKLDGNMLRGTLPSCLLKSPSLQQLSLAGNFLEGTIPPLSSDCKLVMLDLSANRPPGGASTSDRGFHGAFPSLFQAVNLAYLNVQNNSLNGTIPVLPPQLQVLQAAQNQLTGQLRLNAASNLRVLDLSYNNLSGTLPPGVASSNLLTVLRLSGNQLSGVLPNGNWSSYLMEVDLSGNSFTGQDISFLNKSSLIKLNLASNNFNFDIKALANKFPENNSMLYFNISHNNVSGQLTEQLGRMKLFKELVESALADDETLQTSLPPQPLFDISYNLINSTFPLKLLPFLTKLYVDTQDDKIPLSFVLQPQTPPSFIACPKNDVEFPPYVAYLSELQELYNLTCLAQDGQQINISSSHQGVILSPAPLRQPRLPPRPPRPAPPRPPMPVRQTNSTSSGKQAPPPAQGLPSGSASNRGPGGNSDVGVEQSTVGDLSPPPSAGAAADAARSSGGGGGRSTGAIAGGVVGGLLLAVAVAVITYYFVRRNKTGQGAWASRRMPLTFNSAYEAPSEATASNYGDLQMFEFRPLNRDPANRSRVG
ncbi:hypothetical protein Vretimale_3216 [Volvox reticuliferus]|uniref:Malectin-like domain-containing protein n=1 Tax=Volvox reticuliferus TaxID=1737510 RepID=A0A8J4DD42_9CHLO|nr:hypothetical protein Vretifemale_6635 [Volvox reticuliferus]GIL97624.1 hypothetical protein Vretimale_3216 [Volvox reticuliferus]